MPTKLMSDWEIVSFSQETKINFLVQMVSIKFEEKIQV